MLERTSSDELDDSSLIMETERVSDENMKGTDCDSHSYGLETFAYSNITMRTIQNQNFDGSRCFFLLEEWNETDELLFLNRQWATSRRVLMKLVGNESWEKSFCKSVWEIREKLWMFVVLKIQKRTKTTKSLVEPEPKKPRTDKDEGGQDLVRTSKATDKLLSDTWSRNCPKSELEKELQEKDHHSAMIVDAFKKVEEVLSGQICVWPTWRLEEIQTLC